MGVRGAANRYVATMARVPEEFRLLLEEICVNLARFEYADRYNVSADDVDIDEEAALGDDAFADARVVVGEGDADYIEVDWGYDRDHLIASLTRKYSHLVANPGADHTVRLVVDRADYGDGWDATIAEAQSTVPAGYTIEPIDEAGLIDAVERWFGVRLDAVDPEHHRELRSAMDDAKGRYAFGDSYVGSARQEALMWHFGFWRLAELRGQGRLDSEALIPPGPYRDVAVVFADLSGFSSFVRDSTDERTTRNALMSYYAKVRYQTLNMGGMVDQFLGDGSISLFGVPDSRPDDASRALECAKAVLDVGRSVALEWQRRIDRIQPAHGSHVGMAMGDMQIMSLRPYGETRTSIIGDTVNLAARLTGEAANGEIVVSNALYQRLPSVEQSAFHQLDGVDAKNVGRVNAWKLPGSPPDHSAGATAGVKGTSG